jgi:cytochrome b
MRELNTDTMAVWDIGIRIFHWSMVCLFTLSYFSGEQHDLHTWSGYAVLALLGFRLIWGFFGTRHARFTDFLYSPRVVWNYLSGLLRADPPHYAGHNPAGGWMVLAILFTLTLICYSGLEALAEEGDGPLANIEIELISSAYAHGGETHEKVPAAENRQRVNTPSTQGKQAQEVNKPTPDNTAAPVAKFQDHEESFWSELHRQLVNFSLLLISLHIIGVLISSLLHRENLVAAMFHGRKAAK